DPEFKMTTLAEWLAAQSVDAGLASAVASMAEASVEIAEILHAAPIRGQVGLVGRVNVQGEEQKQLDIISNDIVVKHLQQNAAVSILVSEELDEPLQMQNQGRYIIATDPLDGSSNLDVNVTVGTIFSVLEATEGLLQQGSAQLAAGYVAYGPATNLVLSFGGPVVVFTLDSAGIYRLTNNAVAVPHA